MDVAYKLPNVYITKETSYPEEFLLPKEFVSACEKKHIGVKGNRLTKTKAIRCKLNLILTDDKKNQSRGVYIQVQGFSSYGITKYKGEGKSVEEKEEVKAETEATSKKKKLGSWSIVFNIDENPSLKTLADLIDEQTKLLVKPFLPKIYEQFTGSENPEEPPPFIFRKAARASSGSTVKYFRLTVFPGKVELGPASDWEQRMSLNQFPQEQPGVYQLIVNFDHIDISHEKGVITAGAILYAKVIRTDMVDQASSKNKKRKFRETSESEETVQEEASPKEGTKEIVKKIKEESPETPVAPKEGTKEIVKKIKEESPKTPVEPKLNMFE
jgi:hypothetical protein